MFQFYLGLEKGVFPKGAFPKRSLIENIWLRSTQMTQAAPSSLPPLACDML